MPMAGLRVVPLGAEGREGNGNSVALERARKRDGK